MSITPQRRKGRPEALEERVCQVTEDDVFKFLLMLGDRTSKRMCTFVVLAPGFFCFCK